MTIIRPVKGLEPQLYECIASTFKQDYPVHRISIRLCVESESDPALAILRKLVSDFPDHDAQILIEDKDPLLHGEHGEVHSLGPNPKIRNISRAYREAKDDIVWIIDCNVWVARGVLGRMVDKLMGYTAAGVRAKPYKFVHQMPLLVDIADYRQPGAQEAHVSVTCPPASAAPRGAKSSMQDFLTRVSRHGGGRLDEMFFATTHVKFYGAINLVGVAPCIVGKSNMFRRAHLDQVTTAESNRVFRKSDNKRTGVDYFSFNICEDHLIGDLLWRSNIPGFLNHGILWGDLVIQPMAGMSVTSYAARRCRWLRARKFTVLAATLVEPGVESFLCCAYFAFAVTTLPCFHDNMGIPQTWGAMAVVWLLAVTCWMILDWHTFKLLHSGISVQVDQESPRFVRGTPRKGGLPRRGFPEWFLAWLGREVLALPIWTWAVLCGTTVTWRGKRFQVNMDTSVVELDSGSETRGRLGASDSENTRHASKDHLD